MTEFDIQKILFSHFLTLNEFSGIRYLKQNDKGDYTNVHFPNVPFTAPQDKRWYDLNFINAEPSDAAMMEGSQYRFTGVLKIAIHTPTDAKEDEAETKYRWIAKLFNHADLDYIDIMRVYISTRGNDADTNSYRIQITIDWTADIDKE